MRRTRFTILILTLAALGATAVATGKDATYNLVGWRTLDMTPGRIVASGGAPRISSDDGKLNLSAGRLVLTMSKAKGRETLATVEATGQVKLRAAQSQDLAMEATCRKAVVRPSEQRAELSGNVKVKSWDKARYSGPLTLSGETVTLYFREGRVVSTSPSAGGRLSVSPKSAGKR